mgnify:CR=1 FL=1
MPNYRYQIRNSAGQVTAGMLAADNATTAAAILRNQGAHVLSLSPVGVGMDTRGLMAKLAELKGASVEAVARATSANFEALFKISSKT